MFCSNEVFGPDALTPRTQARKGRKTVKLSDGTVEWVSGGTDPALTEEAQTSSGEYEDNNLEACRSNADFPLQKRVRSLNRSNVQVSRNLRLLPKLLPKLKTLSLLAQLLV